MLSRKLTDEEQLRVAIEEREYARILFESWNKRVVFLEEILKQKGEL